MSTIPEGAEETLDPRTPEEWAEFGALAHRMVDDMLAHLAALHEQPAWRAMPDAVREALAEPVPREGERRGRGLPRVRAQRAAVPNGNLHPRFFGWVQGNGTPLGMMADMLAAGLNPHLAGFDQAPARVEEQVIAWLAELMGCPAPAECW
jgi:aromatic-L-amino-acid decarboxylase